MTRNASTCAAEPWPLGRQIVLLLLLTSAAYAALLPAGFVWDDDDYVTANPLLTAEHGLRDIWLTPSATPQYYPLVHTSFWIEQRLWGFEPLGYHVTNVALHLLTCVLLLLSARRLRWHAALLTTLVFALHPLNVQSVAWITERKNVLCGLLFFAALLALLKLHGIGDEAGESQRSRRAWWGGYLLATGLFALALLSKTVACVLPVVWLIGWWASEKRGLARQALLMLPWLLLGGGMGWFTAHLEKLHVGAAGGEWHYSLVERLLIAGRAWWWYVGASVWPVKLAFAYPLWTIDAGDWRAWLWPAGVLAVLGLAWTARKQQGRWPVAALLAFSVTMLPALGFFNIYWQRYYFVANHMVYLALPWLIALLIALLRSAGARLLPARGQFGVAAVLVLLLAAGTVRLNLTYITEEALWRDVLAKYPNTWLASNNLMVILQKQGRIDEAFMQCQAAVAASPTALEPRLNLATLLLDLGRPAAALPEFEAAYGLAPHDERVLLGLARACGALGQAERARTLYAALAQQMRSALAQRPANPAALRLLGIAAAERGHAAEALGAWAQALKLDPSLAADLHFRGGVVLETQQQFPAAAQRYWQALRSGGDHPAPETLDRLARLLLAHPELVRPGQPDALTLADYACQLTGQRAPRYLLTRARAEAAQEQVTRARQSAQQALDLAQQAGFAELEREARELLQRWP